MQCPGNLPTHTLDSSYRFYINLLRRKLYRGIARVYTGKLDVLGDCVSKYLSVTRYGVHLYLFGVFDKLTHHDRMVFTHVGGQLQKAF